MGSLFSRWHKHLCICILELIEELIHLKTNPGREKKRVFISATSTSWVQFTHSLRRQNGTARTEGAQGNIFGWNRVKSQKKHIVTSRRKSRSPEPTGAFLCCWCHQPHNLAKICSWVPILWATWSFSCVDSVSQKYHVGWTLCSVKN